MSDAVSKQKFVPPKEDLIALIMEKTKLDTSTSCVNWQGTVVKNCLIYNIHKNNRVNVAKFLYHCKYPEWDGTEFLLRTCNNSVCINVDHLFLSEKLPIDYNKVWERLLKSSERNDKDCLLWMNGKYRDGYGQTSVKGTTCSVHRMSYIIKNNDCKPIPETDENGEKLVVRHLCNVRNCFEPTHLELGTHSQNNADKKSAGTLIYGDKHHKSKINSEMATVIKHSKGEGTIAERAEKFGVSKYIIGSIDNLSAWCHIPDKEGNVCEINRKIQLRTQKISTPQKFEFTAMILQNIADQIKSNTIVSEDQSKFVEGKCLLWTGSKQNEYGLFQLNKRMKRAHVWSYEHKIQGEIPENMIVRHLCNVKLCCNPLHLLLGTGKENSRDYINSNTNLKIKNTSLVNEIRATHNIDGLTAEERLVKYNIKIQSLTLIENYSTYPHIIVTDVMLEFKNNLICVNFKFDRHNGAIASNSKIKIPKPHYFS